MTSGHQRRKATLFHPRGLKPEDLLTFIELHGFSRDWRQLELTDEELLALQMCIMTSPKGSPVIPGTGGLRKGRFAPPRWGKGKRGAARCCYAYLEEYSVVVLAAVYKKTRKDDLTSDQKTQIALLLKRLKTALDARGNKQGA